MENPKIEENKDKESIAELKALRNKFYDQISSENILNIIIAKSNELKSKYPKDYIDYEAYHILISSTPKNTSLHIDFPEDDSVKNFFQSHLNENI